MSSSPPIISLLKARMHWHQTRQKVLAENVANSDTPRYQPQDLKPFADTLRPGPSVAGLMRTQQAHMKEFPDQGAGPAGQNGYTFETAPSGNAVTLETEMAKVTENQMDFQTVATIYQRSLGYLRIAVGRRG
jgi:flagellar basal-body rod protein FlgB